MPILSLKEYKARREITEATTERDAVLEAALQSAEDAITQYTGRDFLATDEEEIRTFQYDSSTILEVDDFTTISKVEFAAPFGGIELEIPAPAYWVGPREGKTFYWIDFAPAANYFFPVAFSIGQMGFTKNLDTFIERYGAGAGLKYINVNVTASWGWSAVEGIPASVLQAATWLVDEFIVDAPGGEVLASESIANLQYSYQREPLKERPPTLPPRVQQLLDPYRRIAL